MGFEPAPHRDGPTTPSPYWRRRRRSGPRGPRSRSSPWASSPRSPWTRGGWTRPKSGLGVGLDMARSPRTRGTDRERPPCTRPSRSSRRSSGDARRAGKHLETALPLLGGSAAWPWWSIQTRTFLGRAAIGIGDLELAGPLLEQARRELERFPDAGDPSPPARAGGTHARGHAREAAACSPSRLTKAERRVLEVLPTHLSVDAIAETLQISANTVKSHQRAIYRKLGVARRSDAVAAARRHGLLTSASLIHLIRGMRPHHRRRAYCGHG